MDLKLPTDLANSYKSKSQIARVTTEAWVISTIPCPGCGEKLCEYPANERSKDAFCHLCGEDFQIKSSKNKFSKKITGAEYKTTLNSVRNPNNPSLMLLHYNEITMAVIDFQIIHHSFITEKCIIPRRPLSDRAKRAGWQGCLIDIGDIPNIAKITLVENSAINDDKQIKEKWKTSNSANTLKVDTFSWLADVLSIVDKQPNKFTLHDMYKHKEQLANRHPNNNNINAKIRQQLQTIRDMGILEFVERGNYKKVGVLSSG